MKKIILLLPFASALLSMHAQEFEKGTNVASATVGFGSAILSYSTASQSPALGFQFEHGTWTLGPGTVSLGGYVGLKSYKYSGKGSGYSFDEKWNYTIVGVRSAFHYGGFNVPKLDVYAGVMLAYNILHFSYTDNVGSTPYSASGNYGSTTGFSLYVGGRYYFTPQLAALAELGYGAAYFNFGIAYRLNKAQSK
jgi:hypothetical protein